MKDSFEIFNLLAVLGALAWIPTIITSIRNYFLKPKLTIIPASEIEIGYTYFGPIINFRTALISEKKKSLVKRIELKLTHENNDTQKFTWNWFEETLYEVNIPQAGTLPTKKNQNAIALNIAKDELIERKIGFQQNSFHKSYKIINQEIEDDMINVFQAENGNPLEIKTRKSYNDLVNHFKNSFNWKVGNYSLKIEVYLNELNHPIIEDMSFSLTTTNLRLLETNIEKCISFIDKDVINPELEFDNNWFWANITIK